MFAGSSALEAPDWRSFTAGLRLLVLGLCLTACAATTGDPVSGAEARLEVRNARILVLPELAAAYFEVSNRGRADDRLLRIESSIAEIIQMHETVEENGVMRMRPSPEGFSVKAGETLRLEPGGKHLMLLNPLLSENSRPILRLHFEASGVIEVGAEVLTSPGGF